MKISSKKILYNDHNYKGKVYFGGFVIPY